MRRAGECWAAVAGLLERYGLALALVADGVAIPGSYWGAPEAGLRRRTVYARGDTPVHSVLHEAAHVVCMSPDRRRDLQTDAGGTDLEECAVCYLQIVLALPLYDDDLGAVCADMDAWGYTFRLGSARAWFEQDAADARRWLAGHGLLSGAGRARFVLRGAA